MKNSLKFIPAVLLVLASCDSNTNQADAYGNFEATEVIVSSESNGRILSFDPAEGSVIEKGRTIALIDTTLLALQSAEIDAGIRGIRTRLNSIEAQNAILRQQMENLDVNIKRTANLLKDDAATERQMDDLTGQLAVLEKQVEANNTQKASVNAEMQVYMSKKQTLREQIARCEVKSPLDGTLLQKYAMEGELAAMGKPLAKIADLSIMKLKAYVSGSQLPGLKIGQECRVIIDDGEKGYRTFPGTVTYISGKAEFTPRIIQTREERVTLVYAVTIEVSNDGSIKSGMPGEAVFSNEQGN
jgi:HlyD family secretion protein